MGMRCTLFEVIFTHGSVGIIKVDAVCFTRIGIVAISFASRDFLSLVSLRRGRNAAEASRPFVGHRLCGHQDVGISASPVNRASSSSTSSCISESRGDSWLPLVIDN
ncbi:MAG: hypothetical protein A2V52_06440 [Actinobacteria bacterium RBG_19FT_COMBO_54_7]|nr:MAG: hypothetical protein A2V52_06440 [Actinobacteria bacterium RBG_19FT_COMBO_54_7]